MLEQKPRRTMSRSAILRRIFNSVMTTSNQIRATAGSAGAVKYENAFQSKPQYKCDVSFLRYIDYYVDVESAAKSILSPWQLTMFKADYLGKEVFPDILSYPHLQLQKVLGEEFVKRGLYPISKYFKGVTE